jgi:hypothetical protein
MEGPATTRRSWMLLDAATVDEASLPTPASTESMPSGAVPVSS